MSAIEIRGLRKQYGPTVASDSLNAVFDPGTITCLLGPSGCGKTTLLRMIAGFEVPDAGQVLLGGEDVTKLPTKKRDLGMVFQYPVVYRGMSVRQNVELPLQQTGGRGRVAPAQRKQRVDEMLEMMGLTAVASADVHAIPNGMRQKVAVARALIRRHAVVIFDEPVTNVDIVSKLEIQRDIKRLTRALGQTVLYVTHDQTEAMTLADRIVLMRDGQIIESGPPREVFAHPSHTFGGHFLGSPGMNFMPAAIVSLGGGRAVVDSELFSDPVSIELTGEPSADGNLLGVRPERFILAREGFPGAVQVRVIARVVGAGGRWLLKCMVGDHLVQIKARRSDTAGLENAFWAAVAPGAACLFDSSGRRIGQASLAPAPHEAERRSDQNAWMV